MEILLRRESFTSGCVPPIQRTDPRECWTRKGATKESARSRIWQEKEIYHRNSNRRLWKLRKHKRLVVLYNSDTKSIKRFEVLPFDATISWGNRIRDGADGSDEKTRTLHLPRRIFLSFFRVGVQFCKIWRGGGDFDLKSISLLAKNFSNMDENFTRVADSCKLRLTNYPIRSQNSSNKAWKKILKQNFSCHSF